MPLGAAKWWRGHAARGRGIFALPYHHYEAGGSRLRVEDAVHGLRFAAGEVAGAAGVDEIGDRDGAARCSDGNERGRDFVAGREVDRRAAP